MKNQQNEKPDVRYGNPSDNHGHTILRLLDSWPNFSFTTCETKQPFASNSPQAFLNLICLTILITLRPLTQFQPKIRVTNLQKLVLKIVLLDNCFSDLFTEVQIWYWEPFMFGLECCLRKLKQIPAKTWLFLTIGVTNKNIKSKGNFADHHGHNVLRLFNVLANFAFTKCEKKRDY